MRTIYFKNKWIFVLVVFIIITCLNFMLLKTADRFCRKEVQIWGKSDMAGYLWQHILEGESQSINHGIFINGNLTINDIQFKYYSGAGYTKKSLPQSVENLILVLDGYSAEQIKIAKTWLDYLSNLTKLKKLGVVLLGNVKCNDIWISNYLKSKGGLINLLFIIRDNVLIDNKEVFQWPLGVAIFQNFPIIKYDSINIAKKRNLKCNIVVTTEDQVDSRLRRSLHSISFIHKCKFLYNLNYGTYGETIITDYYKSILNSSDYTISLIGNNTESYTIYEAMSFGSIPIVINLQTSNNCTSSMQLLKHFNAPILYVNNFQQVHNILGNVNEIEVKLKRMNVLKWYKDFKTKMKNIFLDLIKNTFFSGLLRKI